MCLLVKVDDLPGAGRTHPCPGVLACARGVRRGRGEGCEEEEKNVVPLSFIRV